MTTVMPSVPDSRVSRLLVEERQQLRRNLSGHLLFWVALSGIIAYAGVFDFSRYDDLPRTLSALLHDCWPPDFSRWTHWLRPLLERLAMSLGGHDAGGVGRFALERGSPPGGWVRPG